MSKTCRTHGIAGASALVLAVVVVACSDRVAESVAEGVVVAQASASAPVTSPPDAVSQSSESLAAAQKTERGTAEPTTLTTVTYGDAEAVYRKGRYADAAELFSAYVAAHPGSVSGQYMLGLSAWKAGDHGRAEQALQRAVELDGAHVKARTNLSRVLLERGRAADAQPHIDRAVELSPESHEVWRVLGNVRSELGRSEEAIAAYRHALIRNERDAWSMNNYGLVLIRQGRYEEAVGPLARAVELLPHSSLFLNNLGVALERSGEPAAALAVFAAAVEADGSNDRAKLSMERVRARLGDAAVTEPDLGTFAASFIEEMQRWRTARPEHDGC